MEKRMDYLEKRMDVFEAKIQSFEDRFFWLATVNRIENTLQQECQKKEDKENKWPSK